jgi:hypothetical protein
LSIALIILWGEAWASGPNINYPMGADSNARALAVLQQAKRLTYTANELQAALVAALSGRQTVCRYTMAAIARLRPEAFVALQRL